MGTYPPSGEHLPQPKIDCLLLVALAESLSDTLASLQTARSGLSNAWALRMSASDKAHFAAVMGNSLCDSEIQIVYW